LPDAGAHLDAQDRLVRQKLVDAIAHIESGGKSTRDAIEEYLRQAAFTILNRFVALRMLEARDLLQQCVSKGDDSSGFKEFCGLAPGLSALPDDGYRLYLECLCDELSVEIKVLFDRRDPTTLLWPRRSALTAMLDVLAQPELASVWAEDETIGWVYQYFNGDEERTQMRAESQAPRNSRELAVRNQFFTPRYVVQFLTDNTLGRTWYEMMQGDTLLAHLDYLVRRPSEVFLAEGESAPESDTDDSELSQEELLNKTVHVPFRNKKDPRDLRILDPACGSGHFLLYTFDLLITIYEEAWADAGAAAFTETGAQLRADYESLEDLRCAMPELILRHNLHGVDIDPRAAQIAALALWMRAQRAYNQFEVDRAQRPPITQTHIVVAEPMPGDAELVDEFAASLQPAVLGDLFKKMVEEMKLAGELGSLLKIEESIAKAVKEAEEAHRKEGLFAEKIESQDFWDTADEKIVAALGGFAAGAGGVRRQLFAGDAAQGVAFIELMRKRFDAVLMNPPFGAGSKRAKRVFEADYPRTKNDVYAAFVERGIALLHKRGGLGAITSRTGFFLKSFQKWREEILLKDAPPVVVADLGHGVMDDAMVEAAAYCLEAI
ncbi:MAG TPA: SAM-dependent methyltransferase, partial [Planctomycetaceae bacterium]|nr:SAM-dependent methyltransferase [Planctomycetaceae bacterium]